MSTTSEKAPALPVTDKVGPRQREYERQKQEKKVNNKAKLLGLITLFIKVNFLVAGVSLWKMHWVHIAFIDVPMYQIVGTTIFAVFGYMELKPYFLGRAKKDPKDKTKKAESLLGVAGNELLA